MEGLIWMCLILHDKMSVSITAKEETEKGTVMEMVVDVSETAAEGACTNQL